MLLQNEFTKYDEERLDERSSRQRLVNGSRGVVIAWDDNGYPIVRFILQGGGTREKTVVHVLFEKVMYLNKTLTRSQVSNLLFFFL